MSQPTSEELAPVFASYGNAVFSCHLLENGLRLLLAVALDARKRQNLPNAAPEDKHAKAKMLGDLFSLALKYEALSDPERQQIWEAIRLRNLLIHNYWTPEASRAFLTAKGRAWLITDLREKREQLRDADRLITKYIDTYLAEHGVTVESLSLPLFAEYEPNAGPPEKVLH